MHIIILMLLATLAMANTETCENLESGLIQSAEMAISDTIDCHCLAKSLLIMDAMAKSGCPTLDYWPLPMVYTNYCT